MKLEYQELYVPCTSFNIYLRHLLYILYHPFQHMNGMPYHSLQNHLSGGGTCQVDDRTYQLEMSLFVGDNIETMTNENFCPQGTYRTILPFKARHLCCSTICIYEFR